MTKIKALILTIIIPLLEICFGFLGELMPQAVKDNFKNFAESSLGISESTLWWRITIPIAIIMIILVWYKALKEGSAPSNNISKVTQNGNNSVNIARDNNGTINIR